MSDVEENSRGSQEAADSPEAEVEAPVTPAKRPRGRPKGSKNKKTIAKEAAAAVSTSGEPAPPRKRGRPPKAKPEGEPVAKRPRGRPPKIPRPAETKPTSKGEASAPDADAAEPASESAAEAPAEAEASTSEAVAVPADPPKKKRGRPPKSKA